MGTYYGLKKGTELFRVIEEVNNKRKELSRIYRELNDRTREFLGIHKDIKYKYTNHSDEGYIIYITKEDYLLLDDEDKERFKTFKRNKYKVRDISNIGYKEQLEEYVKNSIENY